METEHCTHTLHASVVTENVRMVKPLDTRGGHVYRILGFGMVSLLNHFKNQLFVHCCVTCVAPKQELCQYFDHSTEILKSEFSKFSKSKEKCVNISQVEAIRGAERWFTVSLNIFSNFKTDSELKKCSKL